MALLEAPDLADNPRLAKTMAVTADCLAPALVPGAALAPRLTTAEKTLLKEHITAARLGHDVQRYSGIAPVAGHTTTGSRPIHHPGNADAVGALTADLMHLSPGRLSVRTHRFLHAGRPYDNVEAILPAAGIGGIVLVTSHLDSTGARQASSRTAVDPAPGADAAASGVAGVLAAARALLALDAATGAPRRELRFVLFNAAQPGLIGSRVYAHEQARLAAKIVAVLQMERIGYNGTPPRALALHAGFTPAAAVQSRSTRLAQLIVALTPQVSPGLPAPQIYPGPGRASDPAERRSDHYSFQLEGYAACLASADASGGPGPGAPGSEPQPHYHLPAAELVNALYAADIARAIAAAAWVAATH
jgi:hypothetical protein